MSALRNIRFHWLFLVLSTSVLSCTGAEDALDDPKPIRITIWHTESDPDAATHIDQIARIVQAEFQDRKDFTPILSVSTQNWGDIATRLFQEPTPPDITHLQPFMVYQVLDHYQGETGFHLHPLDNLIARIQSTGGPIEGSVLALHRYKHGAKDTSNIYGIAYAVGTTFIAYRKDWVPPRTPLPATWEDLIEFADVLAANAKSKDYEPAPFILPGKSPFFIGQLLNEIVVSLGGSIYSDGKPNFDTPEMARALNVMQDMIARTGGNFAKTEYKPQFSDFAAGLGAVVPVTYGRATKQIDTYLSDSGSTLTESDYAVLQQPGPNAQTPGVATIDAEPWVIIERPISESESDRSERKIRIEIAERFLEKFYEPETYLNFTELVPVHLRPIFEDLGPKYDDAPNQIRWKHWVESGRSMLHRPGGVAPILLDRSGETGTQVKFALSLQRKSVLFDMVKSASRATVITAIQNGIEGNPENDEAKIRKLAIEEAIDGAMTGALKLYVESQ